ncbi:MAG TPA: hypothetical protein VHL11_09445, partial [Phototrophicaceae bacterium]|nr:hypothetical protein [Phototrophicaceae bacterium]
MELEAVTALVHNIRANPVMDIWAGYDVTAIPFAVYDEHQVNYIAHSAPPTERPKQLMAATSVAINGIETATIPVALCTTEETAAPIIYHEGFHVFQHHHFTPLSADMFMAMAFYPELDVDYRTLCRLEIEVLRRSDGAMSAAEKVRLLGQLIALHRARLNRHESLLAYERFLDRSEGTAHYVEQKARQALFNLPPALPEDVGYGLMRFYQVGAALCWLLDETVPDWKSAVEKGQSPGDIILEQANLISSNAPIDLKELNYDQVRDSEAEALNNIRQQIAGDLAALDQPDVIRIRYKTGGKIFRAFTPATLVSQGDGRVLHRSSFKLLLP